MKNLLSFLFALSFSLPVMANVVADATVSLNHNDNIPNAAGSSNVFSDSYGEATFSLGKLFTPAVGKNILLAVEAEARSYQHTDGLNYIMAGGDLIYIQRLGLGAYAPKLNVSLAAKQYKYRENLRDGLTLRAAFGMEKRLSPAWRVMADFQYEKRDANENNAVVYHHGGSRRVFFQQNREVNGAVEYTFENYSSLTLRYRYRTGEADTSTHPGSTLFNFSKAIVWDPGMGAGYVAYLLDSHSQTFGVDWSYPVGKDSAVGFSYENRLATATGNHKYRSNILSAQFTIRF